MANRTSLFFNAEAVRRAVQGAKTQSEALVALGQSPKADNFRRLQEACVRYGLDVPGRLPDGTKRPAVRPSKWDDRELVESALTGANSRSQVLVAMGLALAKKNYQAMERAAEKHGYKIPPKQGRGLNRAEHVTKQRAAIAAMSDTDLRAAIIDAGSSRLFLVSMELEPNQPNGAWLARQTSKRKLNLPVKPSGRRDNMPNEEMFVADAKRSTASIRKRVLRDKLLPYECATCGMPPEWNGKTLTLQLDHIDGDTMNNLLTNLRFLCPNCHSQTDTFCKPHDRR